MKKSIKSLFTGFKKGLLTPTLPPNINKIISYPIIRIFRFLGGISFLFILSKGHLNFEAQVGACLLYVSFFFALLLTIYHIILCYYRTKHIIFLINSGKMDIRNSPPPPQY